MSHIHIYFEEKNIILNFLDIIYLMNIYLQQIAPRLKILTNPAKYVKHLSLNTI